MLGTVIKSLDRLVNIMIEDKREEMGLQEWKKEGKAGRKEGTKEIFKHP